MANVIINPWGETPAEKALRQKGFTTSEQGCMETGIELSAEMTRKDNIGMALQKIARSLWELRQSMADLNWDDSKCMLVIGIQIRNGWQQDGEGQWIEMGSQLWLDKLANQSTK